MNKKLHIVKLGINGEGIGYLDKKPVFVPNALVHEDVIVKIIEDKGAYCKAELVKVIKHAMERVDVKCPIYKECGGCTLMHLNTNVQPTFKKQLLQEAVYKYASIPSSLVRDTKTDGINTGYRSACKLPVTTFKGKLHTGMYTPGSNVIVPIFNCLVQSEDVEKMRKDILFVLNRHKVSSFDNKTLKGIRYLVLRVIDGKGQCTLVTGKEKIPQNVINDLMQIDGLVSVHQSINDNKKNIDVFGSKPVKLAGCDSITWKLNDISVQLSPRSFAQLNLAMARKLYNAAVSKIDPCDTLVEAYCGVGAMSLLAHDKAKKIYGIESIPEAIENAKINANTNNITNVEFICDDSALGLEKILQKEHVNTLLVDPPRSGMDDKMIEVINNSDIEKIIYISCNPSTLAKNLQSLKSKYHPVSIVPFDMFPNTAHVESLTVLLRHGHKDGKIDKTKRKRQAKARAKRCAMNSTK